MRDGCPPLLMQNLWLRELSDLPKVTLFVRGRARVQARSVQLQNQICTRSKVTELDLSHLSLNPSPAICEL